MNLTNKCLSHKDEILNFYIEHRLSINEISRKLDLDRKTVKKVLISENIKIRGNAAELLGKKFGLLTVIEEVGRDDKCKVKWKCLCDCGNFSIVRSEDLLRGVQIACGCQVGRASKLKSKLNILNNTRTNGWKGHEGISGTIMTRIKWSAARRHLDANITAEYLWNLFLKQNKKCALSGEHIYFPQRSEKMSSGTASLDRIDSSQGYTEGNVQWVHKDINLMKMQKSSARFI